MARRSTRRILVAVVAITSLLSAQANASAVKRAEKAIEAGRYSQAYDWLVKRPADGEAVYLIGEMAAEGHLPNCQRTCALDWLTNAANLGSLDALMQIAVIYWNAGEREAALSYIRQAARWNHAGAGEFLRSLDLDVPSPDLWNLHVEQQQFAEQRRHEEQELARAQVRQDLAGALLLGLLVAGSAGNARAGAGRPALQYGDHGAASLVRVQTVGQQRQCLYNTPSGNVTVVVGLSQSCPETYSY